MDQLRRMDKEGGQEKLRTGSLVEFQEIWPTEETRDRKVNLYGLIVAIKDSAKFGKEALILVAGTDGTTERALAALRPCPNDKRSVVLDLLNSGTSILHKSRNVQQFLKDAAEERGHSK